MRIIGGRFRGHRLASVPRRGVRPTADPVREALFNILGPSIAGRVFFDLCAGSGAVGLEALSRGAGPVVLVERSRAAASAIRRNLGKLSIAADDPAVRLIEADLDAWLRSPEWQPDWKPEEPDGKPDGNPDGEGAPIVFLDPPYESRRTARWVDLLVSGEPPAALPGGSLLIVEHASRTPLRTDAEPLWTRRYGDTALTAFEPSAVDLSKA